jgi:histidinol-phosphate/aromatic aminotransferase/cobyric acid decarboxylase-like protein
VGRGTKVLIPEPTFTLYRQLVTVLGGEVISVPLSDRLGFHIARLASKVAIVKPDLTIICSPNNPTDARFNNAIFGCSSKGLKA